jgi:hypothetical protein
MRSKLSIGSRNSVLSIGSVGSVLSIGSVGSALSIGSSFSFASVGSFAATVATPWNGDWQTGSARGSPPSSPRPS